MKALSSPSVRPASKSVWFSAGAIQGLTGTVPIFYSRRATSGASSPIPEATVGSPVNKPGRLPPALTGGSPSLLESGFRSHPQHEGLEFKIL